MKTETKSSTKQPANSQHVVELLKDPEFKIDELIDQINRRLAEALSQQYQKSLRKKP